MYEPLPHHAAPEENKSFTMTAVDNNVRVGDVTPVSSVRSLSARRGSRSGKSKKRVSIPWEFEWWWEIGAIVISLVSTSLILAILFRMNGGPLAAWRSPIQINSMGGHIFYTGESFSAHSTLCRPWPVKMESLRGNCSRKAFALTAKPSLTLQFFRV